MADLELRERERIAALGGVEARAAHLRRRMRAGDLRRIACEQCEGTESWCPSHGKDAGRPCIFTDCSPGICERCDGTGFRPVRAVIELAAYAGDEAAREVMGWPPSDEGHRFGYPCLGELYPPVVGSTNSLSIWVGGLARWGQQAQARAACAAAEVAYRGMPTDAIEGEKFSRLRLLNEKGRARQALTAAKDWLECPCEKHREAWHDASVQPGMPNWAPQPWGSPPRQDVDSRSAIGFAARLAGETVVREAICAALIKWALA